MVHGLESIGARSQTYQPSDSSLSSQTFLYTPGGGTDVAIKLMSMPTTDVDKVLGRGGNGSFELTDDPREALTSDALTGNSWSQESIKIWQKTVEDELKRPGADWQKVTNALNELGAVINQSVSPTLGLEICRRSEPVGMALQPNPDGSVDFYMVLSKDNVVLERNRADLEAGRTSPTIVKVGTYQPGQQI